MLRLRRYRVFLIFAVVTVVAIYKFGGSSSAWTTYEGIKSNVESKVGHKDDATQSHRWEERPYVAQETKKFQVDIPAATSPSRNTPPAIPPISRPADKPSPTLAPSLQSNTPATKPTPAGAGGPDNDSLFSEDLNKELHENGQGRLEVTPLPSSVEPIHWKKQSEHFPIPSKSIIHLPTGSSKPIPKIQFDFKPESAAAKVDRESKLNVIKDVFKHSWQGYRDKAWLQDELSPVSGKFRNPFASWGATLVDALDTLWIMGLTEEFEEAAKAVDQIDFTTSPRADVPLFETTIRYLGGLVAAYDISGKKYKNLLEKAVELAEVLISAFDTPNRMPQTYYYWRPSFSSQPHRASNRVVMAEIGSLSVEFTRLAQLTGEHKYYDAIARITDLFDAFQNNTRLPGMWPTYLDASGCKMIDWSSEVETPLQAPLDLLSETPELSLAGTPIKKDEDFELGPDALSPGGNKYLPLEKPKPVVFVPATVGSTGTPGKETTAPKNLKRQLDGFGMEDDGPILVPKGTQSAAAASATSVRPQCIDQGFVSSSNYGGEDYTLGGMSDSTYEYLPKEYLLLGGQVEKYRTMYEKSMEVVKDYLIFRPMLPNMDDILFSGALSVTAAKPKDDPKFWKGKGYFEGENAHLTCFAGGMFGMGAKIFNRPEDLDIAKKLTEGCVWSYNMTNTGIMPESFIVIPCENHKNCEWNQTKYWEVIDPNAESRMLNYKQQMDTYKVQLASASALYEAELAAMTAAPSATQVFTSEVTPINDAIAGGFTKRQIDENAPHIPSQVGPFAHQEAAIGEPEEAEGPPTKVHANTSTVPDLTKPVFPVLYSPVPPLSHENYVKHRIEEERLPPGVTHIKARNYILRPEAIESVWYMYRITGDPHWREAGWRMFEAVNTHTATVFGNSAIDDVTKTSPNLLDEMESFWLAETLKYFYLLFAEESVVSLDEWVLNTEAHPFKRPN